MTATLVGIVMGSDSDLAIMREASTVLDELGIGHELRIISAHRTPERARAYATDAAARGLAVIIAGAGAAAHLAGFIAAYTPLPVIAVPIASGALRGIDALLSMVQMPPGVPVATVGINGAKNAGLLAAQIVATRDPEVRARIAAYKEKMAAAVEAKDRRLLKEGAAAFVDHG
ncbi:MAG: 5-(carboxyamino)imidazole ribonucleotide mutase [Desulfotomaculales bacterium]